MSNAAESNRQWVTWGLSSIMALGMTLGGYLYTSQQSQIDRLEDKIYEQTRISVTEEKLDKAMDRTIRYIDIRVQNIETSQRETSRQLQVLIEDNKAFRKEMRETLAGK